MEGTGRNWAWKLQVPTMNCYDDWKKSRHLRVELVVYPEHDYDLPTTSGPNHFLRAICCAQAALEQIDFVSCR